MADPKDLSIINASYLIPSQDKITLGNVKELMTIANRHGMDGHQFVSLGAYPVPGGLEVRVEFKVLKGAD